MNVKEFLESMGSYISECIEQGFEEAKVEIVWENEQGEQVARVTGCKDWLWNGLYHVGCQKPPEIIAGIVGYPSAVSISTTKYRQYDIIECQVCSLRAFVEKGRIKEC